MRAVCERAVAEGITAVAFGDLFLEDIRAYRVRQLEGTGLEPLFPVWQLPTAALAREMIRAGQKAVDYVRGSFQAGRFVRRARV